MTHNPNSKAIYCFFQTFNLELKALQKAYKWKRIFCHTFLKVMNEVHAQPVVIKVCYFDKNQNVSVAPSSNSFQKLIPTEMLTILHYVI